MGKYSVPAELRKLKPKGTMVKAINGGYYVYNYKQEKQPDGKYKTHMLDCIGKLVPGIGYVPNNGHMNQTGITVVDYGQYAVAMSTSKDVLTLLKEFFNPEDAVKIYTVSLIHFIEGYTPMKDISALFSQSCLSIIYPTLKVGESVISKLYEDLGRYQTQVTAFQNHLIENSSKQIAIDGHVIGCCSEENNLAQKGHKFMELDEPQINLVMMYDINRDMPLASGIFPGKTPDKVSVGDFLAKYDLHDILFIIDRGFYSAQNMEVYTCNGNSYIIPLGNNHSTNKIATENLVMSEFFLYQCGNKRNKIEFKDQIIDGKRVLVYRDVDEALKTEKNYVYHMQKGEKSYTQEGYEKNKSYWGVTVLQTSLTLSPEEVYLLYKKRWSIEVFYRYLKNEIEFSALGTQNYYKTQGLAFIMLVSSLIESAMEKVAKEKVNMSIGDCFLDAKILKAVYSNNEWQVCNQQAKVVKMCEAMKVPLNVNNGFTT